MSLEVPESVTSLLTELEKLETYGGTQKTIESLSYLVERYGATKVEIETVYYGSGRKSVERIYNGSQAIKLEDIKSFNEITWVPQSLILQDYPTGFFLLPGEEVGVFLTFYLNDNKLSLEYRLYKQTSSLNTSPIKTYK